MIVGKKICFLCPWMNVDGGLQRVVSNLANEFAVFNDVTVAIISSSFGVPYYPLKKDIEIVHLNRASLKNTGIVRRAFGKILNHISIEFPRLSEECFYPECRVKVLESFLEKGKFDVVIASSGDISLLLSKINRKKIESVLIGWQHNSFKFYFESPGKYYYGRKNLVKNMYKKLDKIVCLTNKDANAYKSKFGLSSCCIYNPLSFITEEVANINHHNIIFVGRLEWEQKGLEYLLEIIDYFYNDERSQGWTFTIVGDGSDKEQLENELKKKDYQNKVVIVGKTKDVKKYYLKSSICLNTSKWEGFGLVITEAMECGIPVISFDTDGPAEIISDCVNGYVIPQYDINTFSEKLLILASKDDLRYKMARNARERACDFTMSQIFRQWNELIDSLLKDKKGMTRIYENEIKKI